MRSRDDVTALAIPFPYGRMPDSFARKMRRAYLAAIAYTDSLVGRMVAGVEAAGMTDDTIVTFVGGESRTLWWSEKFRFGADTALCATADHGWAL